MNDTRLAQFTGTHRQDGSDFPIPISQEDIVYWWINRANRTSVEQADAELDQFLDSDEYCCRASLWLFGSSPSRPLDLPNRVRFTSWNDAYDDVDKYQFRFEYQGAEKPTAVVYKDFNISKESSLEDTKELRSQVNKDLDNASLFVNCLPGAHSVAGPRFGRLAPSTPGAGFTQTSSRSTYIAVRGLHAEPIDTDGASLLVQLIDSFDQNVSNSKWKEQLKNSVVRLSTAKRHFESNNIALDLGIALEMILLFDAHGNNERPDQLSLTFRLRGAWLMGDSFYKRSKIHDMLKKVYQNRSQVAHSGGLKSSDGLTEEIGSHIALAEKIVSELILLGSAPKWKELTLGSNPVREMRTEQVKV